MGYVKWVGGEVGWVKWVGFGGLVMLGWLGWVKWDGGLGCVWVSGGCHLGPLPNLYP